MVDAAMTAIAEYNAMLPTNIKRIIGEKGMKQSAVAKRENLTNQQFSDMLNGRKIIKACDAMAISAALGVSIPALYDTGQSSA